MRRADTLAMVRASKLCITSSPNPADDLTRDILISLPAARVLIDQFASRGLLLEFDAGGLDDLAPFIEVAANEFLKTIRTERHHRELLIGELFGDRGIAHDGERRCG